MRGQCEDLEFVLWFEHDQPTRQTFACIAIGATEEPNEAYYEDIAYCHPNDQFKKSTGRLIALHALTRQLAAEGFSREFRKEVWNVYNNRAKAKATA